LANEIRRLLTHAARPASRRTTRPPLVPMAASPPATRPSLPLPATTPERSLSAAGSLDR